MTGSSRFPEIENLVRYFSQLGDLVVDPLAGSFHNRSRLQTS